MKVIYYDLDIENLSILFNLISSQLEIKINNYFSDIIFFFSSELRDSLT